MKAFIALLALSAAAHATSQRVSQSVDANILPAVNVDATALASSWEKSGGELVMSGPTAHLAANVPFTMRAESRVVGAANVAVTVGGSAARSTTPRPTRRAWRSSRRLAR